MVIDFHGQLQRLPGGGIGHFHVITKESERQFIEEFNFSFCFSLMFNEVLQAIDFSGLAKGELR